MTQRTKKRPTTKAAASPLDASARPKRPRREPSLSALGILLKLRERYERVRSPVPLTLLFRWGPRASVRRWLAELENAGLVELTTSDGGVRELAELGTRGFLTSVTPRPWAPTVPEQIARMREGWRRRKRRQRENVTPTVTPPPTPPCTVKGGAVTDRAVVRARFQNRQKSKTFK